MMSDIMITCGHGQSDNWFSSRICWKIGSGNKI